VTGDRLTDLRRRLDRVQQSAQQGRWIGGDFPGHHRPPLSWAPNQRDLALETLVEVRNNLREINASLRGIREAMLLPAKGRRNQREERREAPGKGEPLASTSANGPSK